MYPYMSQLKATYYQGMRQFVSLSTYTISIISRAIIEIFSREYQPVSPSYKNIREKFQLIETVREREREREREGERKRERERERDRRY